MCPKPLDNVAGTVYIMDMTNETSTTTQATCKRAKLPKGTTTGYCENCGEPVRHGLWGYGRSQKFGLQHTSTNDPKWAARMAR
jgi:hypothetical protein